MSAWATVQINGALADSLITDFGGALAASVALPPDQRMCLHWDYAAVAAGQVRIWLASAAGVANDQIVLLYDSAQQLNPGADLTQFLTDQTNSVPIQSSLRPLQVRITKSNTNAEFRFYVTNAMGPG